MSPRVLVTGASGLIGIDVVRGFIDEGWGVTALDVVDPEDPIDPRVAWVRGNILDMDQSLLPGVDVIVHLAALTYSSEKERFGAAGGAADARRFLDVNVLGTEHVFRLARDHRLACTVYASTAGVYGAPTFHAQASPAGVASAGPFRPSSLYAHSKLMSEGLAGFYAQDGAATYIGVRPAFSYGMGRLDGISGAFAAWIAEAVRGEESILGYPFGKQGSLQLIYCKDMARTFIESAKWGLARGAGDASPTSLTLNAPTNEVLTMSEILAILRDVTDNPHVDISDDRVSSEVQRPRLDASDTFELLQFKPEFPLPAAIEDMAKIISERG